MTADADADVRDAEACALTPGLFGVAAPEGAARKGVADDVFSPSFVASPVLRPDVPEVGARAGWRGAAVTWRGAGGGGIGRGGGGILYAFGSASSGQAGIGDGSGNVVPFSIFSDWTSASVTGS